MGKHFVANSGIDLETGVISKYKRIAFDLGIGFGKRMKEEYYNGNLVSYYEGYPVILNLGIGLNF